MAKRLLRIFLSSIGAGILIGMGGFVFLSFKNINLFLASFLFSLGLLTIISFKMYLFTGKIGYAFENKINYALDLLICWMGNLLGAVLVGYILRLTRYDLKEVVDSLVSVKTEDNPLSILILSIFCGILIYVAVEIQKKEIPGCFKLLGIVLPVMVFIISGFEHCIANMFYFSYANAWDLKSIFYVLLMTLGNGLGSLIIWSIGYFAKEKTK